VIPPNAPASGDASNPEYRQALALIRQEDGAAALRILDDLAERGDGHAFALRGTLFDFGFAGVGKDPARAASDYQAAIDLCGADAAARGMAKLLYQGRGVARDLEESFRYYHACAVHTPDPMCRLATGLMLATGEGTTKDPQAAIPFLVEAAEHGYLEAHDALVAIYRAQGNVVKLAAALARRTAFKSAVYRGKRKLALSDWAHPPAA
jgi:TPR repeat protein